MGLSISQSIVQEHGGLIAIESEKEQGATFTVILPVDTPHDSERGKTPPGVEPMAAAGPKKMLVVDDEIVITDLIREILEREGHRVETVNDGPSAIRRIDEEYFDAVISDLKMPVMNGSDIYLHCKIRKPVLARQFLFLTGDIIAPDTLRFIEEHNLSYVAKPFKINDFVSSLHQLFQPK